VVEERYSAVKRAGLRIVQEVMKVELRDEACTQHEEYHSVVLEAVQGRLDGADVEEGKMLKWRRMIVDISEVLLGI